MAAEHLSILNFKEELDQGFFGSLIMNILSDLKNSKIQDGGFNMAEGKHFILNLDKKLDKNIYWVTDYKSANEFLKFRKSELANPSEPIVVS